MNTEPSAEEMCRAAGEKHLAEMLDSLAILIRDKAHQAARAEEKLICETAVRLGHYAVGKSLRVDLYTREDGTKFAIIGQVGGGAVMDWKPVRALPCGCVPGRMKCATAQGLWAKAEQAKAEEKQGEYWKWLREYEKHLGKRVIR